MSLYMNSFNYCSNAPNNAINNVYYYFPSSSSNAVFEFNSTNLNNNATKSKKLKNKFTPEEDEKLKQLVSVYGTNAWSTIASLMGTNRNHRQCRERWKNYVDPTLQNNQPWNYDDDRLLVEKYAELGPKWNKIAKYFHNRSDNSIRNRWQLIIRQWERKQQQHQQQLQIEQTDIDNESDEYTSTAVLEARTQPSIINA